MPKDVITMTRDLFDEMLEAVATKERERIIKHIETTWNPDHEDTKHIIKTIRESSNG